MADNNNAFQQPAQRRTVKVSAKYFASKHNNKRECYQLLTQKRGAYLPKYDTLTIYFIKDLIAGKKKCKYPKFSDFYLSFLSDIKQADAKHFDIP